MDGTGRQELARFELKAIDWNHSGVEGFLRPQEGPNELLGDILTTGQGDVRMPRAKIRFKAGGERGVRHAFVQLKKMRMSVTDPEPNNLRTAFRREGSDPVERKKKARESNCEQLGTQPLFRLRRHISEKGQREMKLFRASASAHRADADPG